MKDGRTILLFLSFSAMTFSGLGQDFSEPPPEPYATTTREVPGSDCVEDPDGSGSIPPPPGLCLPINDYLLALLVAGTFLGSFYILKIQKKENFRNEVPSIV